MDWSWIMPSFSNQFGMKTAKTEDEDDADFNNRKRVKLSVEKDDTPKHQTAKTCSDKSNNFRNKGIQKLWCDKYKPKNMDDLVINRKKVLEVETWLRNVWKSNHGKTLLITGPPGCGKLCTLTAVCRSLGLSFIEWTNPLGITKDSTQELKFQEFLLRASKYSSLITGESDRRIVLIKDIPSFLLENPSVFHEIIIKHTRPKNISPIVFVISCVDVVRDLFPDDVKYQLNLATINFNPVTETATVKALEKVISLERKIDRSFSVPTKDELLDISRSCDGDLRSALLKLQFGLEGGGNADVFKMPMLDSNNKRTRVKKTTSKKHGVKQIVSEIDKDKKLDFFHLVGRVLYPKKVVDDSDPKKFTFVHSPSEIVDNFLTEPNKLVNILHENYLERFSNIKDVCSASEMLENSDVLLSEFSGRDTLTEYALSVTVRGLMTTNSQPSGTKWLPLSKSRIYSTECSKKQNINNLRTLFPNVQSADDALLDVVPYLSKLNIDLPPEKQATLKSLITYKT
ncbi:cell cycle checkpoint protein RAD17 [Nilaparvata lugens]|uniref:cell cycle checkpoint protein RAD17 n=1 Tax=Nilaparvata lugens TaxID=108931 RepID=UPI00193EA8EE|nr:cell cycle checkpoint protein RAD17 [Nilaparvata lugens]